MLQVVVHNATGFLCPIPRRILQRVLAHMLAPFVAHGQNGQCILYVVHDAHMMHMQAEHMLCTGPTNILSFPACDNNQIIFVKKVDELPNILILSVDTWLRECLLYGQDGMEHFLRLLAHGVGHILGYDHGPEMSALCATLEQRAQDFLAGC